jgi:hypothetical protein
VYNENANARAFKEVALDRSRTKYWLGVGAQPSDPVWKLLSMVSVAQRGSAMPVRWGLVIWFLDYPFVMKEFFLELGFLGTGWLTTVVSI